MSFHEDIWQIHKDWCYHNPCILFGLIRSLKPKVIVECGSYTGFSASWMAQALKENGSGHLYCIDNFSLRDHEARHGDARQYLEQNLLMAGVRDWITIIEGDSDKVPWPERVDFAYVDGWHSYPATKHDFDQCADRGAECICLDDTTQSIGPRMLTHQIRGNEEWDVADILRDCGMTICVRRQKKGPITFSQELPNNTGVDLQTLTRAEQEQHFNEASRINAVDYAHMIPMLCDGRIE